MINFFPFLKIIRPVNAFLTALTVFLGFWLAGVDRPWWQAVILACAAVCAVGSGNILNDIIDIEGDKINHPRRPLPMGEISTTQAWYGAIIVASCSITAAMMVSITHGIGTVIPIVTLTFYSLFFKQTPLFGNLVVSMLVAYPILFGALGSVHLPTLVLPGMGAFLLNLSREIVKDIQDKKGDLKTGIATTAKLPDQFLHIIIALIGILYFPFLFAPFFMKHFFFVYLGISLILIVPLHLSWLFLFRTCHKKNGLGKISFLIKLELFCGLIALAADRVYFSYLHL